MSLAVPALRPALGGWAWDWAAHAVPAEPAAATWSMADADLVAEAGGGSAEAFARLVARHQQALRAFLRRACRDWALADDLAQETFLTAWTRIGQLTPDANVRAWLCGIGYNKCLTALRSERRSRRREADYDQAASIAVAPAPEDRMALERAMQDLPLEQRACVALCLAGEFSHAEAADALKLPLGTVKSHVTRGRARLLQALGVSDDQA
jgi:RNA polymerase sigma-70 factor (ECF subfamily)